LAISDWTDTTRSNVCGCIGSIGGWWAKKSRSIDTGTGTEGAGNCGIGGAEKGWSIGTSTGTDTNGAGNGMVSGVVIDISVIDVGISSIADIGIIK